MTTIGTATLSKHTIATDSVVYAYAGNNVSNKDTVALRRELPRRASGGKTTPLRTNVLRVRDFDVTTEGLVQKVPVTISVSITVPVGVDPAAATTFLNSELTDLKPVISALAVSGDVYLD